MATAMKMKRAGSLLLGILILLQVSSPEIFSRSAQEAEVADFIYDHGCVFLRLRVNEVDGLLFLLDTGASASAIDLKVAEKLRLPLTGTQSVEGTAGVIAAKQARIESLSLGNARAKNLSVPAYDLSGALAPPGSRLDGILGYDFLRFFSVRLDFAKRAITLSAQKAGPAASETRADGLPFTVDNGVPRFAAVLNSSVKAEFRLDTGASLFATRDVYLNITEGVWEKLIAAEPGLKPERYFTGSGVGGEIRLPVARIKNLSVGAIHVATPLVIVQPRQGYFARAEAAGFLSNNFLEKFSPVTISYLENKIYLSRQ